MNPGLSHIRQSIQAVILAAAVLLVSSSAANQIKTENMLMQSRIIRSVFSQDSIPISDFVTDRDNFRLLTRFLGAVTSAYINFELIPVNEADTFVAVYNSLNDGIEIEQFEYHRKNLSMEGTAQSEEAYVEFETALRDSGYFASVSGSRYLTVDNTIHFDTECTSAQPAGGYSILSELGIMDEL